jgi:hypothetical protein
MGKKKKNDFKASGSGMKKEVRPNMVPLAVDMARLMHKNWMPCGNWRDVHLPSGALATVGCLSRP